MMIEMWTSNLMLMVYDDRNVVPCALRRSFDGEVLKKHSSTLFPNVEKQTPIDPTGSMIDASLELLNFQKISVED